MSGFLTGFENSLGIQTAGGPIPLTLDTFTFDEQQLEVPESFGDVAGEQSVQEHRFPGGLITHQNFGYFPSQLKWRAKFHGAFASDDVEIIKRILFAGREIQLTYGERAWLGRLVKFAPRVRHQWLYDYDLEFWPRADISSGLTLPPVFTGFAAVLALHLLALQGLLSGQTSLSTFFQGEGQAVFGTATLLVGTVQNAMVNAGNVISNVPPDTQQTIYQQSSAALVATAPFQHADPTLSSPASDVAARVQAIQTIMTAAAPPITTLHVVNPNLVVLATQYYQDPQHWIDIAQANDLSDPMPIGTFTLVIPPNP